ncbi:MAG: thioredoxin family protein [Bacilli bacterium]|nr:thioredoxin family protein [Bacilli bacterium]
MKFVKITASWCLSCILMKSKIESFESRFADGVEIINLDADQNKEEIKNYNVGEKLPVYIIFNGDKEVARLIGEKGNKDLEKFFIEGGVING